MRANILITLALALTLFTCAMASESGTQKATDLRQRMLSADDGIIVLTASDYKEYVLTEPRPYDLVVFFTAHSCKFCDEVYESYKEAAAAYVEAKAIYPAKEGEIIKRSVFYAAIYYTDDTRATYNAHKIERVPDIFVTHPKYARISSESQREDYIKKFLLDASRSSVYVGTSKVLEYVNERVNRKVEAKESVLKLFYVFLILGVPLAALLRVYIKFRTFFNNPLFWLFGSYVIYFICMSGLVYCIIHGTPWTSTSNGEVQWWTSGSRNQLGLEGWIMSGSVLMTGLALLGLQYVAFIAGEGRVQRIVVFVGNILLAWIGMNFVEDIYQKKGGWGTSSFYPPAHYIKGGLMKDQGNTI